MKVKDLKASSASDMVVKQILENIESADLKPGDKLPTQEELGQMFSVGRSSIREATNALAVMGYLDIIQGKGTFIKSKVPVPPQAKTHLNRLAEGADLSNLIKIREMLECSAAEEASVRANEEQLATIKRALNKLEECRENVSDFLQCDLQFHKSIASAANNNEIGEIVELIHNTTNDNFSVAFTTSRADNINQAIETARRAYIYIIQGESKKAARALRNHLSIAKK